jgi:hypothetical protein
MYLGDYATPPQSYIYHTVGLCSIRYDNEGICWLIQPRLICTCAPVQLLCAADRLTCGELKNRCIEYVLAHAEDVCEHPSFTKVRAVVSAADTVVIPIYYILYIYIYTLYSYIDIYIYTLYSYIIDTDGYWFILSCCLSYSALTLFRVCGYRSCRTCRLWSFQSSVLPPAQPLGSGSEKHKRPGAFFVI